MVVELLSGSSGRRPASGDPLPVQRLIAWNAGPRARNIDLIDPIVALTPFGITPSRLNLEEFPGGNAATAVVPPELEVQDSMFGKRAKVVGADKINMVGYRMELPAGPPWTRQVDSGLIASAIGFHITKDFSKERAPYASHGGNTNLEVRGLPNNQRFAELVEQHEDHHVEEVRDTAKKVLAPWDARLDELRTSQETVWGLNADSAKANLYRRAGGTPAEVGQKFENEIRRLGNEFHDTQAGKAPLIDAMDTVADCSRLRLHLKHPLA